MPKFNALSVLQCRFMYTPDNIINPNGREVPSVPPVFEHTESMEALCDPALYAPMGLPVEVAQIRCLPRPGMGPYESISRDIRDHVCAAIRMGKALLINSGFCNYAPAVAGGLRMALGRDARIGLVWLDAHADNRILGQNTKPLRYVSIPLSTICGQTMDYFGKEICGLDPCIAGTDILAADLRRLDDISRDNLHKAGIRRLPTLEDPAAWQEAVQGLAHRVDALYLAIDADILKMDYTPGYIQDAGGGQELTDVQKAVRAVAATGKLYACSTFCFDFDMGGQKARDTLESQKQILKSILESWK